MSDERTPLWTLARVQEYLNERQLQDVFTECILLANEIVTEYERELAPTPPPLTMPDEVREIIQAALEYERDCELDNAAMFNEGSISQRKHMLRARSIEPALAWLEAQPRQEREKRQDHYQLLQRAIVRDNGNGLVFWDVLQKADAGTLRSALAQLKDKRATYRFTFVSERIKAIEERLSEIADVPD